MSSSEITLNDYGLRTTDFRKNLINLFKNSNSLTVDYIKKKIGKRTDKATIYRALNAFEESGIIHQVPDQDNLSRYALCDIKCSPSKHVHQHAHFICNDCSETFCIEQIQFPNTKKMNNFKIQKIEITLQGTCPQC